MTVAFSTSSPVASFAAFDAAGSLLVTDSRPVQGRASEACLAMLAASGILPAEVELWLADLGPGSFTGTRVGVVLVKTFAWTFDRLSGGVPSFDLISPDRTVAIPNRKGEWLLREPGQEPRLIAAGEVEAIGYAPGLPIETLPSASAFGPLLGSVERIAPERLLPGYVVPPSISLPKRPIL